MGISLHRVSAGYDGFRLSEVTLDIRKGALTALIGPNGCGKSTLLKAMARFLPPGAAGRVEINGIDISKTRTRAVARQIAVLPQHPVVPPAIKVEELVGYGRAPHQNLLGFRTGKDQRMIDEALDIVALNEFRDRPVSTLSGGQRQRAFIAMCIAQDTPYVLLDEPTSFLDIKYQYEVLDLMASLNDAGKTVVAVLHDITQAARYASDLVVMKDGALFARGTPDQVVTPDMVQQVYGIAAHVYPDPVSGSRVVSPIGAKIPQAASLSVANEPQHYN